MSDSFARHRTEATISRASRRAWLLLAASATLVWSMFGSSITWWWLVVSFAERGLV